MNRLDWAQIALSLVVMLIGIYIAMPKPRCTPEFYLQIAILLESRRADSNRFPLLQLRVRGQWLLGVAGDCNSRIVKGISVPCIAHYCRVLRAG